MEADVRTVTGASQTSDDAGRAADTGSLQRGLAILESLTEAGRALSLAEIAETVGVASSSCHRTVQVLLREGYVSQDPNKKYRASPKALLPLSLYHPLNLLRRDAHDLLSDLSQRFGLTSSIVVFVGTERLVLDIVDTAQSLSPYYQTHLQSPLHASASGKVLLLGLNEKQRRALLGPGPYQRHTSGTLVTPEALEEELGLAKQRGYAVTLGESFEGMSAVAAPVAVGEGRFLGCFAIVGDSRRFAGRAVEDFGLAVKAAADLFSVARPATKIARSFFNL